MEKNAKSRINISNKIVVTKGFGEFFVFIIFILASNIREEIQIDSDAREADMLSAINRDSLIGAILGVYRSFKEYRERSIIDENEYTQYFLKFIVINRRILEEIIIVFSIYLKWMI